MSTADRIAALRAEGEAAVAAASSTAELEDVRVRFLGRKAELPNLLRDVGKLPPEERGVGRQGRQRGAPGARGRGRRARATSSRRSSSRRGSRPTSSTSRCPARPLPPAGHLHVLTATRREIEDVFVGLGYRVVEGPEIDLAYYNFDALNHAPGPPGARGVGHVLRRRRRRPAHADLADAGARDGAQAAAALHHRPGARLPARQRRHAHAAVPPGRGAGGGRGPDARRPAGHAAGVRPRDLRRRPRGPPAPALLPVHRARRSRST